MGNVRKAVMAAATAFAGALATAEIDGAVTQGEWLGVAAATVVAAVSVWAIKPAAGVDTPRASSRVDGS